MSKMGISTLQSYKGAQVFEAVRRGGYVRVRVDGQVLNIDDEISLARNKWHDIDVVTDRIVIPAHDAEDADRRGRATDLQQLADTRLEPDPEEDEDDAQLGEHLEQLARLDDPEHGRAYRNPGHDLADESRLA